MSPVTKFFKQGSFSCGRLGGALSVVVILITVNSLGCGSKQPEPTGEETASPAVVEEAAGTEAVGTEAATSESPGDLVLPPGEIPDPSEQQAPAATEGGFELPDDVTIPDDSGAAAAGKINVEYASWEAIQSAAQATGRVTVVDLWSLACEPCLKEFPGLVRLHEQMGEKVQCIAVDLDFDGRKSRPPESYEEQVVAFLQSVNAEGFPLYVCSTPSDEVFAAAKLPSIPAVLIFDAQGQLATVFVDAGETVGFTYEKDIVPAVEKLAG